MNKKIKNCIWCSPKIKEQNHFRSVNGYVLEPVLIVFMFVLLFSTWVAIQVEARSHLLRAAKRSDIDLTIIERAKYVAGDLAWKKRCGLEYQDQQQFDESIKDKRVHFHDLDTYLECSYVDQEETYKILVFYDATGIVKVEYNKG